MYPNNNNNNKFRKKREDTIFLILLFLKFLHLLKRGEDIRGTMFSEGLVVGCDGLTVLLHLGITVSNSCKGPNQTNKSRKEAMKGRGKKSKKKEKKGNEERAEEKRKRE